VRSCSPLIGFMIEPATCQPPVKISIWKSAAPPAI
jgi:hypothetical protein